jgi:hypothetical protein
MTRSVLPGRRVDPARRCGDRLGWDHRGVRRPDGDVWEVAHNPAWTIDDDGTTHLERATLRAGDAQDGA